MADEVWAPGTDDTNKPQYVSLTLTTRVLVALQLGMVGMQGLVLGSSMLMAVAEPGLAAEAMPATVLGTVAFAVLMIGALGVIGLMLSGFPVWVYWHWRAAENLRVLGVRLTHAPSGHAGWWFVPFANLIVPFRAMVELYRASTGTDSVAFGASANAPPLFNAWWACWIFGNILGNLSYRMADAPDLALMIDLVGTPLSVIATVLYLKFVREISAGQQAIAAAWTAAPRTTS